MSTVADDRFIFVDTDTSCAADVSKVLLVYDHAGAHHDNMVRFLTRDLGYHVITLHVDDTKFAHVSEFTRALDGSIPRKESERQYVFYVFQFSSTKPTVCMYCDRDKTDSSRLLKTALATCYVRYGSSRCAIVHPETCCAMDDTLLPAAQIEDMHIAFRPVPTMSYLEFPCCNEHCGDNETVRTVLTQKLRTIRDIDARRDTTRHVVTVQTVERAQVEQPLSHDQVLRLLGTILQAKSAQLTEVVVALGVSAIEWEPHYARFQSEALYMVLKRAIRTRSLSVVCDILSTVVDKELVDGLRSSGSDDDWYLSAHPAWQSKPAEPAAPKDKEEDGEPAVRPNPSESTHIDQVNTRFLPPFLRDQLEKQRSVTGTALGDDPVQGMKLLQDMDKEYEKRKLERELSEYRAQVPSANATLMSGYSMRDAVYTCDKVKQ